MVPIASGAVSIEFLSDEWVDAMHAAARARPDLADVVPEPLTIQQEVAGTTDASWWHVCIGGGAASVGRGAAPDGHPTVRIRQDRATAAAIARGELSAQRAFMTGRLRIGGDLAALLEHAEALALLDDVFAAVRADTVFSVDRSEETRA
jgi:putative sterol carrier protein